MNRFNKFSAVTVLLLFLFGCGGGGGSSSGGSSTPSAKSTGVFLDSPVINIGYRTETLEGVTNSLGEYKYLPGETVTFFIGALNFPAVAATGTVTPLNLAGTQYIANSKVMNMIRLLQTLDQDGDPSNGITITDQAKSSATQVDFNLSEANFAASSAVMNLIFNAGLVAPVTELVSAADALAHFKKELMELGIFSKVLADNFDSGALATGVWKQSLDGVERSIQGGRLVNTVTSSGPQVSVNTGFIADHTYMETTVRISSASTITVGARGKARLAGYFYNDRRGLGSGLPHNGSEGDVWGQVEVNLLDDRTLVARAFLGPDDAGGTTSIATFLNQTFSTSVQFDTDYVMSIEQAADGRLILTFNGESFIYQETGPMYPISDQPYQGLTARIYAGGTGGTLLVEWDDVYVEASSAVNPGGPTTCQIGIVADGTCVQLGFTATNQALAAGQTRAYEWKGVTPGKTYRVSISATNTIGNMPVYDNVNFNPPTLCLVVGPPGSCDAVATGTSLYILVGDTGGGGTFTLDVVEVTNSGGGGGPTTCQIGIVADGTCVQLGFTATNQALAAGQTRAYEWKGVTPGKTYRVSISATNTIGNMPVYDNVNFNPPLLCLVVGPPGSCDAVATGTSLYILVGDTGGGGTFTLNVEPV